MKKYIAMAALAAATISLTTSCSDEELVKVSTKTGDPIRFTATTKQSMQTRTVYGDPIKEDDIVKAWPIHWIANDEVTIHCPEANTQGENQNTATYTVLSSGTGVNTSTYELDGDGLHWGASEEHNFYEAYPSENVTNIKDGTLTATLPSTQEASLQPDGSYADMSAALMAGSVSTSKKNVAQNGLDIPFEPIFTAVNITIKPSTTDMFRLSSISVSNIESVTSNDRKPLAGKISYDYTTGDITSAGEESYNVQVEFPEEINIPTVANGGQDINVTVFLRGDFDMPVKVVLNGTMINGETHAPTVGSIKKQCSPTQKLKAGARNQINMGSLLSATMLPMTGEYWVSHMHNATYVSQMSLPGVYDAANFMPRIAGDDRAQTVLCGTTEKYWSGLSQKERIIVYDKYKDVGYYYGQMAEYLNRGNRVFDFKPTRRGANDWITERVGNLGADAEKVDFEAMVNATVEWLTKHTTEFIIFILSDNNHTSTSDATMGYSTQDYYNNLMEEIVNFIPRQYRLDSFGPDVTVEEARGKILIINGTPCKNAIGLNVPEWKFNKKVSATSGTQDDSYFENSGVFYNMVAADDAKKQGKIWVEDFNNGANHNGTTLTNKDNWIKGSIDQAKADTTINNWYITSTAFRHWVVALGSDYTYGDGRERFQATAIDKVNTLSQTQTVIDGKETTKYEKCGIILQAYAGQTVTIGDGNNKKTYSLEDVIWANNYKGDDGPLKAESQY